MRDGIGNTFWKAFLAPAGRHGEATGPSPIRTSRPQRLSSADYTVLTKRGITSEQVVWSENAPAALVTIIVAGGARKGGLSAALGIHGVAGRLGASVIRVSPLSGQRAETISSPARTRFNILIAVSAPQRLALLSHSLIQNAPPPFAM